MWVDIMQKPVVVVGMGELGEIFARGLLKLGHPVVPVLRGMDMAALAETVPEPERVIVAVGEADLDACLNRMPPAWRGFLVLLQNELLPRDWQRHGIQDPTVIVVWLDKKKGRPSVNVLPTLAGGPGAALVCKALAVSDVPAHPIPDDEIVYELVRKNVYILTINIAGLRLPPGATVSDLWNGHQPLAQDVAHEIIAIQSGLVRHSLPAARLMDGMLEGFQGDWRHICTGRSAPVRLQRALDAARSLGLQTPVLDSISASLG